MFSSIKRLFLVVFLLSSIALNVATVASTAIAGIVSNVFEAATGLPSVQTKIKKKRLKSQKAVKKMTRKITRKISKRTVKSATRNAGSVVAEAIPYVGIAAMLGVTAMDLYDACETMKDMRTLNDTFELGASNDEDFDTVCGKTVPDVNTVLREIEGGTAQAWQDATDLVPKLPSFSEVILRAQSGADTVVDGTSTAFYVTFDRAQNGAVKAVSGADNIIDIMIDRAGAGANSVVRVTAKAFKAALGIMD